jgi:hypothetical protein
MSIKYRGVSKKIGSKKIGYAWAVHHLVVVLSITQGLDAGVHSLLQCLLSPGYGRSNQLIQVAALFFVGELGCIMSAEGRSKGRQALNVFLLSVLDAGKSIGH